MGGYEPITTWKEYVQVKTDKLHHQFDALEKSTDEDIRNLFAGVSVWVNGYTVPSSIEIKRLMGAHGGNYEHFYSKSTVTHIIATMLPDSKIHAIKNELVVRPQWIVDSIARKKLLPVFDYLLYNPSPKQNISKFYATKLNNDTNNTPQSKNLPSPSPNPSVHSPPILSKPNPPPPVNIPPKSILKNVNPTSSSNVVKYPSNNPTPQIQVPNTADANTMNPITTTTNPTNVSTKVTFASSTNLNSVNSLNSANATKSSTNPINSTTTNSTTSTNSTNTPKYTKATYASMLASFTNSTNSINSTNFANSVNSTNIAPSNFASNSTINSTKIPSFATSFTSFNTTTPTTTPSNAFAAKPTNSANTTTSVNATKFVSASNSANTTNNTNIRPNTTSSTNTTINSTNLAANNNTSSAAPTSTTTVAPSSTTFNAASAPLPTAVDEDFVANYFHKSRLAHLSNWRQTFQDEITAYLLSVANAPADAVDEAEDGQGTPGSVKYTYEDGSQVEPDKGPRVVLHVDMDCFFASVGIRSRPHLFNSPVVVAHSASSNASTSSVASCNYVARKFGIRNGSSVGRARQLCPDIVVLPYEFDKYEKVSKQMYEILLKYTKRIQVGSCDEALLELTGENKKKPLEVALQIRKEIADTTGCTASVGVGENILLARLACRKAKPNGQCLLLASEVQEVLASQDVDVLPGLGWKTARKLAEFGITICKELVEKSLEWLQKEFGQKTGKNLYNYCRGIDDRPLKIFQVRKSHGVDVTWGVRFATDSQAYKFIHNLAMELAQRLESRSVSGRMIVFKLKKRRAGAPVENTYKLLGHGIVDDLSRSVTLNSYTRNASVIFSECCKLYDIMKVPAQDVRGIGIHLQKLDTEKEEDPEQPERKDKDKPADNLLSFFKKPNNQQNSNNNLNNKHTEEKLESTEPPNKKPKVNLDEYDQTHKTTTTTQNMLSTNDNNENNDKDYDLYTPFFHDEMEYLSDNEEIFDREAKEKEEEKDKADISDDKKRKIMDDEFEFITDDEEEKEEEEEKPQKQQKREEGVIKPLPMESNSKTTVHGFAIPSPSQLDTSVLKYLPFDLRRSIEKAYDAIENPPAKRKTKTKQTKPKSVKKRLFPDENEVVPEPQKIEVDPEFLNALPEDIRKEVEQQILNSAKSTSTTTILQNVHPPKSIPPPPKNQPPKPSPPPLRSPARKSYPLTPTKSRDLHDILQNRMADAWQDFSQFLADHIPSQSHCSVLEAQLVKWVDHKNLEDVSYLLLRMRNCALKYPGWAPVFNELLAITNQMISVTYNNGALAIQSL